MKDYSIVIWRSQYISELHFYRLTAVLVCCFYQRPFRHSVGVIGLRKWFWRCYCVCISEGCLFRLLV